MNLHHFMCVSKVCSSHWLRVSIAQHYWLRKWSQEKVTAFLLLPLDSIFPWSSTKSQLSAWDLGNEPRHGNAEVQSPVQGRLTMEIQNERIWSHCRVISSQRGSSQSGRVPGMGGQSSSLLSDNPHEAWSCLKEAMEWASCKNMWIWQFMWPQVWYG